MSRFLFSQFIFSPFHWNVYVLDAWFCLIRSMCLPFGSVLYGILTLYRAQKHMQKVYLKTSMLSTFFRLTHVVCVCVCCLMRFFLLSSSQRFLCLVFNLIGFTSSVRRASLWLWATTTTKIVRYEPSYGINASEWRTRAQQTLRDEEEKKRKRVYNKISLLFVCIELKFSVEFSF